MERAKKLEWLTIGWLTAAAAALGILGIGYGLWWADAVAAGFISLDIIRDGYSWTCCFCSGVRCEGPLLMARFVSVFMIRRSAGPGCIQLR